MARTQVTNERPDESADKPIRIAFSTLGCKVNQAETESLARQFQTAGFLPVDHAGHADVFVVNTCTVTHIANRKSRQLIRQIHRTNPAAKIVVTGCYAQMEAAAIQNIDGVALIVGTQDKARLLDLVKENLDLERGSVLASNLNGKPEQGRTRGLVKIQDGCNNFCSYCIVPHARGRSRSVCADSVIQEIIALVSSGHQEIVLTGVHAGAYGTDKTADGDIKLAGLIQRILSETALPRLRLSSVEPWDLEPALLELLNDPRLCRHLHLPLQSGADPVLERMRRRYNTHDFATLVQRVRDSVPGIAITTDVIVGFPGETEKESEETYNFCREMRFARIHVFKYSIRRGTLAATMPGQTAEKTKSLRSDRLIGLSEELARNFHTEFLNTRANVLWEGSFSGNATSDDPECLTWTGFTDNYIRVYTESKRDLGNRILPTQLVDHFEAGLWGQAEPTD